MAVCVATYQSLGLAWKASGLGDDFSHARKMVWWRRTFGRRWALHYGFLQSTMRPHGFILSKLTEKDLKTTPSGTEEAQSDGTTFG